MARTIKEIYDFLDKTAPFSLQESYDNSGLIIGNASDEVGRVMIALDVTREIANEANDKNVDLIITHHPLIFKAVKRIDTSSVLGKLIAGGVDVISAHTSFDSAKLNDVLCDALGLALNEPLHVENGVPCGYVCECEPITAKSLAENIKENLGCSVVRYNGCGKTIKKIAVCSGSGGDFLSDAILMGCDAYITGDVKHSVFIDAHNNGGISVFDAGHFHTENIFCEYLCGLIKNEFADIDCFVSESNKDILSYEV